MGKISDKSSYKNMKTATKSSQFFIAKQAAKAARAKQQQGATQSTKQVTTDPVGE
ncbi:hypothetical protein [Sporomusa malonica]|uniref:Uncharacterized protein n=1 Tax=Sporomusa malonica TaxID=112901 RepID=A0A1W2EGM3_9FIRM|nr:hypothetical protein [Sporomusa malonica]SMD08871.1 hypothetical protein SAMN04488500_12422 [Sporomusa malonica]